MGLSIYKIKKWTNMLLGNSVHHVNQGEGKCYSKEELKGYYNDLTEKVTRFGLASNDVPLTPVDTGENIYFSIAIFQYGLGSYDLYLENNEKDKLEKAVSCANWAVDNQENDGSWITFAYENKDHPYSSMAQGEGVSLLIRLYDVTREEKYLISARKAIEFMLLPIESGGTTKYEGDDVFLYECTHDPLILNGWIFSLWGLYDYCKYIQDENIKFVLDKTLLSFKKRLQDFDIGYWSNYEEGGKRICSSFYHKLHIAQLRVMYDLFGDEIYKDYADKWEKYLKNFWNPKRAFLKKAIQKILE